MAAAARHHRISDEPVVPAVGLHRGQGVFREFLELLGQSPDLRGNISLEIDELRLELVAGGIRSLLGQHQLAERHVRQPILQIAESLDRGVGPHDDVDVVRLAPDQLVLKPRLVN